MAETADAKQRWLGQERAAEMTDKIKASDLSFKEFEALTSIRTALNTNPNLDREAKVRVLSEVARHFGQTIDPDDIGSDNAVHRILENTAGMNKADKKAYLKKIRGELHRKALKLDREKADNLMKQEALTERMERAKKLRIEVVEWLTRPIELQKPTGTIFNNLREAFFEDKVICPAAIKMDSQKILPMFNETWDAASVFVIEHDWAAAFDKASDFSMGEFKLPADTCIFEFRISGTSIVATVYIDESSGMFCLMPAVKFKNGWIMSGTVARTLDTGVWRSFHSEGEPLADSTRQGFFKTMDSDDAYLPLFKLIFDQIRAVSIVLDAEIAQTETIRAPHRSNQSRDRKPLPEYSYHVVSLARRQRAAALPYDHQDGQATRKRMHFRRGHWRHFHDHKTWIKWMLVGDPDLGFVDKHYKL